MTRHGYFRTAMLLVCFISACDESFPSLVGTWNLVDTETSHCENASMDHDPVRCNVVPYNDCINIFTETTWRTESDSTLQITYSFNGKPYNGLTGGNITAVDGKDCMQNHVNTCIIKFMLSKSSLTLYQTGRIGTPEANCLIVKKFVRK